MKFFAALCFALAFQVALVAQQLQPGFQKEEYRELMLISARTCALAEDYYANLPEPRFKMIYQSPTMGLDNRWDLWIDGNGLAVISVRGTTDKAESWLANFYSAMVPASGRLTLSQDDYFDYHLADNPKAAVHVGWLLSTAYLSRDIVPYIHEMYNSGNREILVVGHSQGGGIAFLLTTYLYQLQKEGKLPADIRFKTYCSAAPKPGNQYFAYHFEAVTFGGWAFNVVNEADWVPEMPFSLQTIDDFNPTNPFINAKDLLAKQPFPNNVALKHVFNKLDKNTRKSQRNFEKYLGEKVSKSVQNYLPNFVAPAYAPTNNYARCGHTIVLLIDENYRGQYPDDPAKIWTHHLHHNYLYLIDILPEVTQ